MPKTTIKTDHAPAAIGPYSQAVVAGGRPAPGPYAATAPRTLLTPASSPASLIGLRCESRPSKSQYPL